MKLFRSLFGCCMPPQDQASEASDLRKKKQVRLILPEIIDDEESKSIVASKLNHSFKVSLRKTKETTTTGSSIDHLLWVTLFLDPLASIKSEYP